MTPDVLATKSELAPWWRWLVGLIILWLLWSLLRSAERPAAPPGPPPPSAPEVAGPPANVHFQPRASAIDGLGALAKPLTSGTGSIGDAEARRVEITQDR